MKNRLLIFIMNQYSWLWFYWKRLTASKRHCLTIDTPVDEIMDIDYCSFCESQLRKCECFTDIILLFKKREMEIARKIAQPIFDKANGVNE